MKNKAAKKILCLSVTAMLGIASPAAVMAAEEVKTEDAKPEETAAENGEEAAPEGESKTDEERVPEDVTVTLMTGDLVLKNETKRFFAGAEYRRAESKVVENAEVNSEGSEQVAQTWDLVLTEEEGTVHTFQDVRADKWQEPVITEQFDILYVTYQDEENQKQEAFEDAEEKNLETPVAVYALTEVNIREIPDTSSQSLKVTKTGEEWSAVAALPGWVKVEGNGVTGYVHHEYITEDKEAIGALQTTAQNTTAAQQSPEQEPQNSYQEPQYNYQEPQYNPQPSQQEPAQTQQPAAQEPAGSTEPQEPETPGDSGEVTELNREDIPNEAGDGHGVYEITYSDGSVVYEEY